MYEIKNKVPHFLQIPGGVLERNGVCYREALDPTLESLCARGRLEITDMDTQKPAVLSGVAQAQKPKVVKAEPQPAEIHAPQKKEREFELTTAEVHKSMSEDASDNEDDEGSREQDVEAEDGKSKAEAEPAPKEKDSEFESTPASRAADEDDEEDDLGSRMSQGPKAKSPGQDNKGGKGNNKGKR